MSVLLLIGSSSVRSALLWLAHRPLAPLLPVTVLGAALLVGITPGSWAVNTAGALTLVGALAGFLADRLHRELDGHGVPCRWCEVESEVSE
ncbi:hypothetical protein AB0D90_28265 [Streptomyces althioticus]|uniref:hypothetical protein n=1 Tax=Streptomyces althioticus TaxID=83380 RepID=UPI0033ECB8A7